MSSELKLRRGTTLQHSTFVGADSEITFNTDTNELVSHDGVTPGGFSGGGYLPAGTGAVATTVQAKLRESVSVLDFGASPSASASENTAAIQLALNAAAGGMLIFPSKSSVYEVNDELTPSNNTVIDLGGNTLKQAASAKTENGIFFLSGKSNIHLRNGTIDVNVSAQGYTEPKTDFGRSVFIYNSTNCSVKNIKFQNPYGSMVLVAASSKIIVEKCDINDANGTGTSAIMFNTCSLCDVISCTGVGKVGVTGYGVYATGTCSQIRALDNSFTYWQIVFSGADYITGGGGSGMAYCTIDRNTLIEPSADTSIHFGVHGSVCDNIIINSRDVGISIDFSTHTVCNSNVIRTTNASGIVIAGSVDCTVVGNMLSNPGSQWVLPVTPGLRCGVWGPNSPTGSAPFQTPTGNVIANNTIRDDLGPNQMYYGISLYDDGGTNINNVRGNYISGALAMNYSTPNQTNVGEMETVKTPSYLNSWVDYGTPFVAGGYYKTEDEITFLRGLVKNGTLGVIFNLPAAYRPLNQLMFTVTTDTGVGRLDVYQNGDVYLASGGTGFVSLSGISFPIER